MTPRYRQLRQDANRSQQELADYLHISQGQYGKIERQESRITDDKLLMLAQYYQTSTSYLLGETDDPTPPGGDPEDKLPPLDPIKEGILDEYRKLDQPGKHALYTIAVALRHAQGDLAGAQAYLEQALAIQRQVLGERHPDTAKSINNLGGLLYAQGDLAGAKPYFEQALAIQRQVLGEQHPATALSLNNLGSLLQAQGDLAGAKPYYERALTIRLQVLGEQHPDTAQSLNNLGGLLLRQGDLAGAKPYYEQALAILERALGPGHPNTVTVRDTLAYLGLVLRLMLSRS